MSEITNPQNPNKPEIKTTFQAGPNGGLLIFEKIPAIMREVGAVTKARQNKAQGFAFRGIDDVYNALHGLMGEHGVFSVPVLKTVTPGELPTKNGSMRHCAVVVEYFFFASDGSSFVVRVPGEAADTGDKSTGKAMSYAHKIALIQVFALETDEQQDPDYDSYEYVSPNDKSAQNRNGSRPQNAPQQPQAQQPRYETFDLTKYDNKGLADLIKWARENQPQHPQMEAMRAEYERRRQEAQQAKQAQENQLTPPPSNQAANPHPLDGMFPDVIGTPEYTRFLDTVFSRGLKWESSDDIKRFEDAMTEKTGYPYVATQMNANDLGEVTVSIANEELKW